MVRARLSVCVSVCVCVCVDVAGVDPVDSLVKMDEDLFSFLVLDFFFDTFLELTKKLLAPLTITTTTQQADIEST